MRTKEQIQKEIDHVRDLPHWSAAMANEQQKRFEKLLKELKDVDDKQNKEPVQQ